MRKTTLGALAAGAALALAPGAHAQNGESAMLFDFTAKKPGTSTALTMAYAWEGQGQPDALRGLTLTLPSGTKVNPNAAPVCTADVDKRFDEGHKRHCPANTQIGEGEAKAYAGETLVDDRLEFWNSRSTRSGLNVENYVGGARLYAFGGLYKGRKLDFDFGGPQRLTEFGFGLERHSRVINGKRRGYITTPRKCPKNGKWKMSLTLKFDDGRTQKLTDTSRCSRR